MKYILINTLPQLFNPVEIMRSNSFFKLFIVFLN